MKFRELLCFWIDYENTLHTVVVVLTIYYTLKSKGNVTQDLEMSRVFLFDNFTKFLSVYEIVVARFWAFKFYSVKDV